MEIQQKTLSWILSGWFPRQSLGIGLRHHWTTKKLIRVWWFMMLQYHFMLQCSSMFIVFHYKLRNLGYPHLWKPPVLFWGKPLLSDKDIQFLREIKTTTWAPIIRRVNSEEPETSTRLRVKRGLGSAPIVRCREDPLRWSIPTRSNRSNPDDMLVSDGFCKNLRWETLIVPTGFPLGKTIYDSPLASQWLQYVMGFPSWITISTSRKQKGSI